MIISTRILMNFLTEEEDQWYLQYRKTDILVVKIILCFCYSQLCRKEEEKHLFKLSLLKLQLFVREIVWYNITVHIVGYYKNICIREV
mgnify:CR=1 FL=1|jgi:hypothetical protein